MDLLSSSSSVQLCSCWLRQRNPQSPHTPGLMTAAEMEGRIAETSPRASDRITAVVYLLYFLTAVSADVFVGRGRLVVYDVVNLIAYVFYIIYVCAPRALGFLASGVFALYRVDAHIQGHLTKNRPFWSRLWFWRTTPVIDLGKSVR